MEVTALFLISTLTTMSTPTPFAIFLEEENIDFIALALATHIKLNTMQDYLYSPHAFDEMDANDFISLARALNFDTHDLHKRFYPND